jgi:hypothetical protein
MTEYLIAPVVFIIAVMCIYIITRVMSAAIYRSKQEHLKTLKGDKTHE